MRKHYQVNEPQCVAVERIKFPTAMGRKLRLESRPISRLADNRAKMEESPMFAAFSFVFKLSFYPL
jgi:hypothetical protein